MKVTVVPAPPSLSRVKPATRKPLRVGLVQTKWHADPTEHLEVLAEGIAAAKRLTRAALDRPLSEGLSEERRAFLQVTATDSARAALEAARQPVEIQKV